MSSVYTTFVSEMTKKILHIALTCFLFILAATPIGATSEHSVCPMVKIEAVRLPHLNVARSGHSTFCANGEVVVVGGHTTGFVPTATAEYLKDGEWHLMKTVYAHDQGFFLPLRSGKVMIGGGHEQHLGIGQIFATEFYDPKTHTFTGWGCLDKKRCMAGAVELDDGKVYITGNWYNDDSWERYDGAVNNTPVKEIRSGRSYPYVFRTAKDNAIVLGNADIHGNVPDTFLITPLKGEPFTDPLFDTWRPLHAHQQHLSADNFIGNEAKGIYAYLMLVENKAGQYAIIKTENGKFSLFSTKQPIPSKSKWGRIHYFTSVITDQKRNRGYVMGADDNHRFYILCICLSDAALTLYYTDPLPDVGNTTPVLTPCGNLIMTGGSLESNFAPYATAVLLPVSEDPEQAGGISPLVWLLVGVLLLILLLVAGNLIYKHYHDKHTCPNPVGGKAGCEKEVSPNESLMQRIETLMEQERPYLRNDLKVTDVADMLGAGSRAVSDAINQNRNMSFSAFVNSYRIAYAQQLLHRQPDMKLSAVSMESGFANESSFFRTFKLHTGMTPREWIALEKAQKD